jgi:uncharacterized MAPEG superfamily protein
MTPELTMLGWVLALTALMWIPYVLDRIRVQGLIDAVGYPDDPKPPSPWAERARKAHYNAVENLVVFAAAVLALNAAGIGNDVTALACTVYFWVRLVHYIVYTAGIPWLRTLSYAAGWVCSVVLILELF